MAEVYKTVKVRPIKKEEIDEAEDFQNMVRMFYETFTKNEGRMGVDSFRDYQNLKKNLKRYSNRPWFYHIRNFINRTNKKFEEYFQHRRKASKITPRYVKNVNNRAIEIFSSGNVNEIVRINPMLSDYVDSFIAAQKTSITDEITNPIYIQNPLFFGSRNFVHAFETPDIEKLINKDLRKFRYTYLDMVQSKADNFQYMIYWIQELKDTDDDVDLTKAQFTKYLEYVYDTPEFSEYLKMIQDYLSDNRKSLLPKILEKLKDYPTLYEANEEAKKTIHEVYRGIGFYYEDEDYVHERELINYDREQKYIATTTSYRAAQNFAYMRGHLERTRRSDYGYIISYGVEPDAILLDTNIFGGKFFEDEIVIDARKAKVNKIDFSEKEENMYENSIIEDSELDEIKELPVGDTGIALNDKFTELEDDYTIYPSNWALFSEIGDLKLYQKKDRSRQWHDILISKNNRMIGMIILESHEVRIKGKRHKIKSPYMVYLKENHRRKGIGTLIYDSLIEKYGWLMSSGEQTKHSINLWRSLARKYKLYSYPPLEKISAEKMSKAYGSYEKVLILSKKKLKT